MDRLFRRYADPFSFIGPYFQAGRFREWVLSFIRAENRDNEERQEEKLWELWLHRYRGDMSFAEWKESLNAKPEKREKPKEATAADMAGNLDVAFKTLKKIEASQKGGE